MKTNLTYRNCFATVPVVWCYNSVYNSENNIIATGVPVGNLTGEKMTQITTRITQTRSGSFLAEQGTSGTYAPEDSITDWAETPLHNWLTENITDLQACFIRYPSRYPATNRTHSHVKTGEVILTGVISPDQLEEYQSQLTWLKLSANICD
jgi:hypothetical protein